MTKTINRGTLFVCGALLSAIVPSLSNTAIWGDGSWSWPQWRMHVAIVFFGAIATIITAITGYLDETALREKQADPPPVSPLSGPGLKSVILIGFLAIGFGLASCVSPSVSTQASAEGALSDVVQAAMAYSQGNYGTTVTDGVAALTKAASALESLSPTQAASQDVVAATVPSSMSDTVASVHYVLTKLKGQTGKQAVSQIAAAIRVGINQATTTAAP